MNQIKSVSSFLQGFKKKKIDRRVPYKKHTVELNNQTGISVQKIVKELTLQIVSTNWTRIFNLLSSILETAEPIKPSIILITPSPYLSIHQTVIGITWGKVTLSSD